VAETKIGDILPWEDVEREAEKLLESTRANARDSENSVASQEQDDDRIVDRDETDPYNEVIFGRRRPDSVAIQWTSKTVYVLEFKRTSDQRQDCRERGEGRALVQHDVLVKSLDTVDGHTGMIYSRVGMRHQCWSFVLMNTERGRQVGDLVLHQGLPRSRGVTSVPARSW